jgi:hypothetical protein
MPSAIPAGFDGLSRLEIKQFYAAVFGGLGTPAEIPAQLQELLSDSACFACLTDLQLASLFLYVLAESADETIDSLREKASFMQSLTEHQLNAICVYQLTGPF